MTFAQILDTVEDAVSNRERIDPCRWIRDATDAHRRHHRCWAYPYADGTVLGAITGVLQPARVLELGAALGSTACWWGQHAARVDTIENDPVHVPLARDNVRRAGLSATVTVHEGDFDIVVPTLDGPYDLAFFDGYEPPEDLFEAMTGPLGATGALITTNLDLGHGRFRSRLASSTHWRTCYVDDLAISVRA